ncbi:MAG: WYL domain-containing protein [Bacteroidia bacterium]|nr:WYL domain-containing protein [Bacteroidia bacterium]
MALNKNALIRYKTIDKCLQNVYRQWTLEDLIEACSEALYEYEGRAINVSKRTVQLDIQMMRSDKLGYNAPIVVYDKKYYKYDEDDYSITDIPITDSDMKVLSETVEMLKQFKDFSLFSELGGIIQRLEDKVYTEKTHQASIIHLDKNESLKGLQFLDPLYQAILKKIVLKVTYQSFTARQASVMTFHAYILKEFNNRWFVVGRSHKKHQILTLALDRIVALNYDFATDHEIHDFDGDTFYDNTIGVTVLNDAQLQEVHVRLDHKNAPYVMTKPFHHSQQLVEQHEDRSMTFRLRVHLNFELERMILGFGDAIEVLKPRHLRKRIMEKHRRALERYELSI